MFRKSHARERSYCFNGVKWRCECRFPALLCRRRLQPCRHGHVWFYRCCQRWYWIFLNRTLQIWSDSHPALGSCCNNLCTKNSRGQFRHYISLQPGDTLSRTNLLSTAGALPAFNGPLSKVTWGRRCIPFSVAPECACVGSNSLYKKALRCVPCSFAKVFDHLTSLSLQKSSSNVSGRRPLRPPTLFECPTLISS